MQKENENPQFAFIELLKNAVPSNINLAEEISSVIGVSSDSAYRRLRCETDLTLKETLKLCRHFDLPLDSLDEMNSEMVSFKINKLSNDFDSFGGYLEAVNADLAWMTNYEERELIYAAEDLPVFYSFVFRHLSQFKLSYWNKSIQNVTEMQGMKVEDVKLPEKWHEIVRNIVSNNLKLNTTEIWNEDTLKSTIRQIRFYWEAGFFRERETALNVIGDLKKLIDTIQAQCETGKKMNYEKSTLTPADFTLYVSDLMIGNNCVLLKAGNKVASYIGYNSFNYMRTSNSYFNEQEEIWIQNLISKSTLVSKVSEKLRNQFIKVLHGQVNQLELFILES